MKDADNTTNYGVTGKVQTGYPKRVRLDSSLKFSGRGESTRGYRVEEGACQPSMVAVGRMIQRMNSMEERALRDTSLLVTSTVLRKYATESPNHRQRDSRSHRQTERSSAHELQTVPTCVSDETITTWVAWNLTTRDVERRQTKKTIHG